MKKFFTFLTVVLLTIISYSQAPQKLSYQAVIRNNSGQLVTNHAVGIKISILQGSATGTVVYSETYNPVPQTNANGLVTLEIGNGTPVSGTFSSINWGSGTYYLKTEADPSGGTNYTLVGTSQFESVPYALLAKSATSYTETDPAFSSSPAFSITLGDISGWNYLSAHVVRLEGDQTITGIKKFNSDLIVNGLTIGKGKNPHNANSAIGVDALLSNLTGDENTAIGYKALESNYSGYYNTVLGSNALKANTSGNKNIAIGFATLGRSTKGEENTGVGNTVLAWNSTGRENTAIGSWAMYYNETGNNNTAVGSYAGRNNKTGVSNIFIGSHAGYYETGSNKLIIDNQGRANESDARVKALVYGVFNASTANQSLTINGNATISGNATVTGNLQVGSSYGPITSNWWEYGTDSNSGTGIDFHSNTSPTDYSARIHRTPGNDGEFQIVNAGAGPLVLYTSGGLGIVGLPSSSAGSMLLLSGNRVYAFSSSIRTKENIIPLSDNFSKILDAQPVSFTDKATGVRSIGYIAEEFEKDGLQNLLVYENGKLVSLRYDLISVYNVEVIKKQQEQIEKQQKLIEEQQKQIDEIKQILKLLKQVKKQ